MSTPARRQYLDIKARHQDAILLYQVGDFFETFDEDARVTARELQLVLTSRAYGPGERVPLAGVPLHALETYAARLVARGYTIAICEQVAPPGRGLVKREVTRILTPGTLSDPSMLHATRDNYLAAITRGKSGIGLAYVDVNSGAFACTEWRDEGAHGNDPISPDDALRAELQRLTPAEVLVADHHPLASAEERGLGGEDFRSATVTACPAHYFDTERARERLCRHFHVTSLDGYGCAARQLAVAAAGAILTYVTRMNPALARLLTDLHSYDSSDFVEIDGRTWRALEVLDGSAPRVAMFPSPRKERGPGREDISLLAVLDATRTAPGARLLRRTLLQPLRDRAILDARLDAVAELYDVASLRERVAAALDGLGDLQRLTARVVHGTALPRELRALAASLVRASELRSALREADAPALCTLRDQIDPCDDVREHILRAVEDPDAGSGRTVCQGYDAELDAQHAGIAQSRAWIAGLEAQERERTGIKTLKVGYNQVFGYYLEISKSWLERVPEDYQRRQTIAGGERYVTAELKEQEALVLAAQERIAERERTVYAALLAALAEQQHRLRTTAAALAQADVWLSLALVARSRGYVRPVLLDTTELDIRGGRHPIVEAALDGAQFVPNETQLDALQADGGGTRQMLLTGPNMAGKSTYLRQIALIVLLAQIGSFVPADSARIGLVDRIFARVGAQDDLARGLSTFMMEMVETAYILRHATPRSLIILDEVGRGTSTGDGLAIARAVLEYLHDTSAARALFATHFHELAAAADSLPRLRVCRLAVAEKGGEVVFLYRVTPGAADASYGVRVARMAGLPAEVVERATSLLAGEGAGFITEGTEDGEGRRKTAALMASTPPHNGQIHDEPAAYSGGVAQAATARLPTDATIVARPNSPLAASLGNGHDNESPEAVTLALAGLNIAAMTPIEAINLLFSLQQHALAALRRSTT